MSSDPPVAPGTCSNCGSELLLGAPFCGNCGASVGGRPEAAAAPQPAAPQAVKKPGPANSKTIWWGLLILGFLVFYWYVNRSDEEPPSTTARSSPSTTSRESPARPTPPVLPTVPIVVESVVPPAATGPEHFVTPTRNIGCYVDGQSARCDIAEKDWTVPPKPQSCELDWGQGLVVTEAGANLVCAGDTTLGSPTVLDYGLSSQRGNFRCAVSQQGVTCTNVTSGKGFKISRSSYALL